MTIENRIFEAIRKDKLLSLGDELESEQSRLPWWRVFRRAHIESELRMVAFAGMIYTRGQMAGMHMYDPTLKKA